MLLAACVAAFLTGTLSAQDEPSYVQVFYIDVLPGKGEKFRDLMLDEGVKIAQSRANSGVCSAWYFMRARVPSGERANADYIIVNVMADGFDSPRLSTADALKKANDKMSSEKYWENVRESSKLLYTDIWSPVAQVSESEAGNFVLINYMDVSDFGDWLEIEHDIVAPSMEAQVADGNLAAWGSYRLFLPRGSDLDYNAGTVDVFADWSAIGKPRKFGEYLRKANPGIDMDSIGSRIGKARDIVRSDLYEVLAKVTPSR